MACEKCWNDAYVRHVMNPQKTQAEYYRDLLDERKERPCSPQQQLTGYDDYELLNVGDTGKDSQ